MSEETLLTVVLPLVAVGALAAGMLALAGVHLRWLSRRPRGWRMLP